MSEKRVINCDKSNTMDLEQEMSAVNLAEHSAGVCINDMSTESVGLLPPAEEIKETKAFPCRLLDRKVICQHAFVSWDKLKKHRRRYHNTDYMRDVVTHPYICRNSGCRAKFKTKQQFEIHQKKPHDSVERVTHDSEDEDNGEDQDYGIKGEYVKHENMDIDSAEDECPSAMVESTKAFPCQLLDRGFICQHGFESWQKLLKHRQRYHCTNYMGDVETHPYTCQISGCSAKYKTKQQFISHQKIPHDSVEMDIHDSVCEYREIEGGCIKVQIMEIDSAERKYPPAMVESKICDVGNDSDGSRCDSFKSDKPTDLKEVKELVAENITYRDTNKADSELVINEVDVSKSEREVVMVESGLTNIRCDSDNSHDGFQLQIEKMDLATNLRTEGERFQFMLKGVDHVSTGRRNKERGVCGSINIDCGKRNAGIEINMTDVNLKGTYLDVKIKDFNVARNVGCKSVHEEARLVKSVQMKRRAYVIDGKPSTDESKVDVKIEGPEIGVCLKENTKDVMLESHGIFPKRTYRKECDLECAEANKANVFGNNSSLDCAIPEVCVDRKTNNLDGENVNLLCAKMVVNDESPLPCKCPVYGCKQVFASKREMEMHQDRPHMKASICTDQTPYPCTIYRCNKIFNDGSVLKDHMHTPHEFSHQTKLKTPCYVQLVGPSRAGKTTNVLRMLMEDKFDHRFDRVVIWRSEFEPGIHDKIQQIYPDMELIATLPENFNNRHDNPFFDRSVRNLFIADDMQLKTQSSKPFTEFTMVTMHHVNVTCIHTMHNVAPPAQQQVGQRLNLEYFMLFRNHAEMSQCLTLGKRVMPLNKKYLFTIYEEATAKNRHQYIFLDYANEGKRAGIFTEIFL